VSRVRGADADDRAAVRNVIDGANLELPADTLDAALGGDGALVAESADGEPTVLGALVLDGERIAAVAVRPGRRGQGIGTALVDVASGRRERLVAIFDPDVEPFWRSLGFDIHRRGDSRRRGLR
jgi:GNAT superfamily N-acetyltransferase